MDDQSKNKLIAALKKDPGITAALLFGSQASGHATSESDIDVAVLYDLNPPEPLDVLQFKQQLSDVMNLDVDFVILNNASPILAMQAISTGVPLFIDDMTSYREFEVRLITDYADLKMMLKPFEENILKRKLHDE